MTHAGLDISLGTHTANAEVGLRDGVCHRAERLIPPHIDVSTCEVLSLRAADTAGVFLRLRRSKLVAAEDIHDSTGC